MLTGLQDGGCSPCMRCRRLLVSRLVHCSMRRGGARSSEDQRNLFVCCIYHDAVSAAAKQGVAETGGISFSMDFPLVGSSLRSIGSVHSSLLSGGGYRCRPGLQHLLCVEMSATDFGDSDNSAGCDFRSQLVIGNCQQWSGNQPRTSDQSDLHRDSRRDSALWPLSWQSSHAKGST